MAFPPPIFKKLATAEEHCQQIPCTEFHTNQTKNLETYGQELLHARKQCGFHCAKFYKAHNHICSTDPPHPTQTHIHGN